MQNARCTGGIPTGGFDYAGRGVHAAGHVKHSRKGWGNFPHMLGVYVYNFIQLAQTSDPDKLWHLSRVLLHGIHTVLLPPAYQGTMGKSLYPSRN